MKLRTVLGLLVCLAAPLPAQAQIRQVRMPVHNWANAWAGLYTTVDYIFDPATNSSWHFDDNVLALGAGFEREITQGILLGAEGSWASTDFLGTLDNDTLTTGTARLLSAFATGRAVSGGAGSLSGFLKGMIGTFGYRTPAADGTNYDFALGTGAGLDYRFGKSSVFLEWTKIWAYHDKQGLDQSNTARHALLRAGLRHGF